MINKIYTREQILKEGPKLVEYGIMRGWLKYPKRAKLPDHWRNGNDLSDEEIQELRQTLDQSADH